MRRKTTCSFLFVFTFRSVKVWHVGLLGLRVIKDILFNELCLGYECRRPNGVRKDWRALCKIPDSTTARIARNSIRGFDFIMEYTCSKTPQITWSRQHTCTPSSYWINNLVFVFMIHLLASVSRIKELKEDFEYRSSPSYSKKINSWNYRKISLCFILPNDLFTTLRIIIWWILLLILYTYEEKGLLFPLQSHSSCRAGWEIRMKE